MQKGKIWLFWILLFSGIILGGLLGELALKVPFLSWLGYGQTFGLTEPLLLDIKVLKLSFSIVFNLNIASVIGILLAVFVYRKI